MAKEGCMICGKEKHGIEVEEDYVIAAMRWFKRNVTKNAKNYKIVVCKTCAPEYKKLRKKYVRRRAMYITLGVVFTLMLVLISGGRSIAAVLYGVGITVFLYLLTLVSYMPGVKDEKKLDKIIEESKPTKS